MTERQERVSYTVLGPRYLVQLPEPEAVSEAGIVLPEVAQDTVYDGVVVAAGTGRVQDDGSRWPLQARAGDRVVTTKAGFQWWDVEQRLGFVADTALIACIPGPEHAELLPCGDTVLVRPDRLYGRDPETGATVQVTDGGILLATCVLPGNEEWAEREGRLAYEESCRLWDSPEWQAEPEYYRHRRLHDYLDGLHPDVRRVALRIAEGREGPEFEHRWVKREAPLRGVVVAVGPGRVVSGSRRLGVTVAPGDVVRWSATHLAQVLAHPDGEVSGDWPGTLPKC